MKSSTNQPPEPRYLTIEEFSQRFSLSVSTVRRRIRNGQIPVWQPGGPRTRLLIPAEWQPEHRSHAVPTISATPTPSASRGGSAALAGPVPRWKQNR